MTQGLEGGVLALEVGKARRFVDHAFGGRGLAGGGRRSGRTRQVRLAEGEGIETGEAGEARHVGFDREAGLGRPPGEESRVGHRVREKGAALHLERVVAIRTGERVDGPPEEVGRMEGAAARIEGELGPGAREQAVRIESRFEADERRQALDRVGEGHARRALGRESDEGGEGGDDGGQGLLVAGILHGLRNDQADPLRRQVEDQGDVFADVKRIARRAVDGEEFFTREGDRALGLRIPEFLKPRRVFARKGREVAAHPGQLALIVGKGLARDVPGG